MHVFYDSTRPHDLVTGADAKPVTTSKQGPTAADAPPGTPSGGYWLQVTDEDDTTEFAIVNPTVNIRGRVHSIADNRPGMATAQGTTSFRKSDR